MRKVVERLTATYTCPFNHGGLSPIPSEDERVPEELDLTGVPDVDVVVHIKKGRNDPQPTIAIMKELVSAMKVPMTKHKIDPILQALDRVQHLFSLLVKVPLERNILQDIISNSIDFELLRMNITTIENAHSHTPGGNLHKFWTSLTDYAVYIRRCLPGRREEIVVPYNWKELELVIDILIEFLTITCDPDLNSTWWKYFFMDTQGYFATASRNILLHLEHAAGIIKNANKPSQIPTDLPADPREVFSCSLYQTWLQIYEEANHMSLYAAGQYRTDVRLWRDLLQLVGFIRDNLPGTA